MPIHYTDPYLDVPPGVNFLDAGQVSGWVAACEVDKPWRDPMRECFADLVGALPQGAQVLELGSGPGYLAQAVLQHCPHVESYTLLDFSEHMLQLSRTRLAHFEAARFVKADFKTAAWHKTLLLLTLRYLRCSQCTRFGTSVMSRVFMRRFVSC